MLLSERVGFSGGRGAAGGWAGAWAPNTVRFVSFTMTTTSSPAVLGTRSRGGREPPAPRRRGGEGGSWARGWCRPSGSPVFSRHSSSSYFFCAKTNVDSGHHLSPGFLFYQPLQGRGSSFSSMQGHERPETICISICILQIWAKESLKKLTTKQAKQIIIAHTHSDTGGKLQNKEY